MRAGGTLAGRAFLLLAGAMILALGASLCAVNAAMEPALKRWLAAGFQRTAEALEAADLQYRQRQPSDYRPAAEGPAILEVGGQLFEANTVPVPLGRAVIGGLTCARKVRLESLPHVGHLLLMRDGVVVDSTLPRENLAEIQAQAADLSEQGEIRVAGQRYLALEARHRVVPPPYRLVNLQSIDAATAEMISPLRTLFAGAGVGAVVLALLLASAGSRTITRPLDRLMEALHRSERTGRLAPVFPTRSGVREVNRLAEALNRAAVASQQTQGRLEAAYLEFIETMAQALDARDPYTAGHSNRVGELSEAIALQMSLSDSQVAKIRGGARLHDIGKIGIPDAVLQKPGRLTTEEFGLIKLHPQIGRRILERAGSFGDYLAAVELHHENHDGTGYPYGLAGDAIPMEARIVHVADAYDAMTTCRSYRETLGHDLAIQELRSHAGRMFDPAVVAACLEVLKDPDHHALLEITTPLAWSARRSLTAAP